MSPRTRRFLWTATVIVAFIVGYLLGRRKCAKDMASGGSGSGAVVVQGAPSEGPPSPVKVGGGDGTAASSGGKSNAIDGGVDSAKGGGANGSGGGGDAGNGGGSGVIPPGSGEFKKLPVANDSAFGRYVAKLAEDRESQGSGIRDTMPPDPRIISRIAHDFSLDGTGLPRYPNGVTRVVSALATRPDVPADSGTGCGILTSDSFETVVGWYHTHMPAGWHELSLGNMEHKAKQLSPQKILKMLTPARGSDTVPAPDTGAAGGGTSVAIWTAPGNGTQGKSSVMVASVPGLPTHIMMTRSVRP
jgi:hypothetical protein